MKSKIKICGLKNEKDIEYVNELIPDYIGFVFAKSKRQIDINTASKLKSLLDKRIKAVGVFVNEEAEVVADIANQGIIDIVQLHGDEDEEYMSALRRQTNTTIIKAFKIQNKSDIYAAAESSADYVLLDNGSGGTGKKFEWNNIGKFERKYFLAGGINEENLRRALKYCPYAVDVSSGVESNGIKDYEKMKKLISIIRN